MKKISNLICFLNKEGFFSAALSAKKLAAVQLDLETKRKIQSAEARRSSPFASWFPEGQRVYLPIEKQFDRAGYAEEKFKYLKKYMDDYGHNWSYEEIFDGRKGREKLNAKWIKRNILVPYSAEQFASGDLEQFALFNNLSDFKKYSINLFNKLLSNTYDHSLTLDDHLKQWGVKLDLEDSSLENLTKINNAKVKIKNIIDTIRDIEEELSKLFNDPIRLGAKGDLLVVISMRGDDIATMSTGRRWTSCMELNRGAHYKDVFCEISDGGFVAYLINSDDKNIEDPLARLLVRRFDSQDGKSIAVPEGDIYSSGEEYPELIKAVDDWISGKQGSIYPSTYKRMGGKYSDTFDDEEAFGIDLEMDPKRTFEVMKDPANFFLQNYDIKDSWSVTDNFHKAWEWWLEGEEQDEPYYDEYGYEEKPPAPLNFPHLKESKIFNSKEEAEKWVEGNSLSKELFKFTIESDLEDWRHREEERRWGEDISFSDEIVNKMKDWVDNNERYTISRIDAMSKATDLGKELVQSKTGEIMRDLLNRSGAYSSRSSLGSSKYYNYMLENKDDLIYFYNLVSSSKTSKKQIAQIFPDIIGYDSQLEENSNEEIDYFYLRRSFKNIIDESLKKKELKS